MEKLSNQQQKVYDALDNNRGTWVKSDYFLYTLHLSQFHARMDEMELKGIKIITSDFTDEFGYKSYMLPVKETLFDK